jgi:hypothetical protein
MKEATVTISFRLSPYHLKLLREAASLNGRSPALQARQVVIEWLTDANQVRIVSELAELRAEVSGLKDAQARATLAILVDAGKASLEEAEAFVRELH